MVKKSVTTGPWTIEVLDTKKIQVKNNGELVGNTLKALQEIATQIDYEYDPAWNTHYLGRVLADIIKMKESMSLDIDGRTKVIQLKRNFKCIYSATLRVYDGNRLADDNATLSQLRAEGLATGDMTCTSKDTVEYFKYFMNKLFGLRVEIATIDNWVLVLDKMPLYLIKKAGKNSTKDKMEKILEEEYKSGNYVEPAPLPEVPSTPKPAEKKMNTYRLRIQGDSFARFDTVALENADEDEISEGFEDEAGWTGVVGQTLCQYTRVEDMDSEDEDDEAVINMIGDASVCDSGYYADYDEGFSVVVVDENEKVVATIKNEDIAVIDAEQGSQMIDDEDVDHYDHLKKYLEIYGDDNVEHLFPRYEAESWYWLNVQTCEPVSLPEYELTISGEFEPSKLCIKRTLLEEAIKGMQSLYVASEIIYDGNILDASEPGVFNEIGGTNYIIKMDEDGEYPEIVYDMTNMEEA